MEYQVVNAFYGHSLIIRQYSCYSSILPLSASVQHGWHAAPENALSDFYDGLPLYLTWSKRYAKECEEFTSNSDVVPIGAPLIYAIDALKEDCNAEGTIVFPVHSSGCIDYVDGKSFYERYVAELKTLPKEYFPLCACMYHVDIDKGYSSFFEEAGIKVVCNGTRNSDDFLLEFKKNTKGFKYASSNCISSAAFYSIYLGLKFFAYGDTVSFYNKSNVHHPEGVCDHILAHPYTQQLRYLWDYRNPEKYKGQKEIAFSELGVDCKKTPEELNYLLVKYEYVVQDLLPAFSEQEQSDKLKELYNAASTAKASADYESAEEVFLFIVEKCADVVIDSLVSSYVAGAYFHLGEIELQRDDFKKAAFYCEKCLALNPSHKKCYKYLNSFGDKNEHEN